MKSEAGSSQDQKWALWRYMDGSGRELRALDLGKGQVARVESATRLGLHLRRCECCPRRITSYFSISTSEPTPGLFTMRASGLHGSQGLLEWKQSFAMWFFYVVGTFRSSRCNSSVSRGVRDSRLRPRDRWQLVKVWEVWRSHLHPHAPWWGLRGDGPSSGNGPKAQRRGWPSSLTLLHFLLSSVLCWEKNYLKLRISHREVSTCFPCHFGHCSMGLTRIIKLSSQCNSVLFCSLLSKSQTLKLHVYLSLFVPERCKWLLPNRKVHPSGYGFIALWEISQFCN